MRVVLPALIWLLLGLAIVAVATLAFHMRHASPGEKDPLRRSARRILSDCESLLLLIHGLQQHRGMSSAWLAGDSRFDAPMRSKRRDVFHAIDALGDFATFEANAGNPALTPYELSLLATQWKELCAELDGAGERPAMDANITRHSLLVSHVLSWLAATGERHLAPSVLPADAGLLRTWLVTLPALGEQLGQARAIGSGAAARGRCSPAERMRLMFLASGAESLMHQAIAESPRLPGALPATERVVRLLSMVRGDLLGDHPQMTAETFFAEATAAIDAVYAWMNTGEEALRHALTPEPVETAGTR